MKLRRVHCTLAILWSIYGSALSLLFDSTLLDNEVESLKFALDSFSQQVKALEGFDNRKQRTKKDDFKNLIHQDERDGLLPPFQSDRLLPDDYSLESHEIIRDNDGRNMNPKRDGSSSGESINLGMDDTLNKRKRRAIEELNSQEDLFFDTSNHQPDFPKNLENARVEVENRGKVINGHFSPRFFKNQHFAHVRQRRSSSGMKKKDNQYFKNDIYSILSEYVTRKSLHKRSVTRPQNVDSMLNQEFKFPVSERATGSQREKVEETTTARHHTKHNKHHNFDKNHGSKHTRVGNGEPRQEKHNQEDNRSENKEQSEDLKQEDTTVQPKKDSEAPDDLSVENIHEKEEIIEEPKTEESNSPNVMLTHNDIRQIANQSDLAQIFTWLEELADGQEERVANELLAIKAKNEGLNKSKNMSSENAMKGSHPRKETKSSLSNDKLKKKNENEDLKEENQLIESDNDNMKDGQTDTDEEPRRTADKVKDDPHRVEVVTQIVTSNSTFWATTQRPGRVFQKSVEKRTEEHRHHDRHHRKKKNKRTHHSNVHQNQHDQEKEENKEKENSDK